MTLDDNRTPPAQPSVDTAAADWPAGIGAPATRALIAAGYGSVADLAGVPKSDLARLHGVGPASLRVIERTLATRGDTLA